MISFHSLQTKFNYNLLTTQKNHFQILLKSNNSYYKKSTTIYHKVKIRNSKFMRTKTNNKSIFSSINCVDNKRFKSF